MSKSPGKLRLGTRGSALARTQSEMIAAELRRRHPGLAVETIVISTTGDKVTHAPLHEFGGKGLFTKELELALLAGEIDFAVHSMKDVPVTMPLVDTTDLVIAAVPPRENPADVLVSRAGRTLADLPQGARVGTGSLRRRSQLLAARGDLQVLALRGNIDTRLRKLAADEYDAIILAAAGLRRLGVWDESIMSILDPGDFVPAAAQGALAIECRADDRATRDRLAVLEDPQTRACVAVEREIVRRLNGDCHSPIAAHASWAGGTMTLRVVVGERGGGGTIIRAQATGETAVDQAMASLDTSGAFRLLHG